MIKIFLAIFSALGAIVSIIEIVKIIIKILQQKLKYKSIFLLFLLISTSVLFTYLYFLEESSGNNSMENIKEESEQNIYLKQINKNTKKVKGNFQNVFLLSDDASILVDSLVVWEDPIFKKVFTEYFGKEEIYYSDLSDIYLIKLYGDDFAYINAPDGDINSISNTSKFGQYIDREDKRYIYKEDNHEGKIYEFGKYISLNDIKKFPNLNSITIGCFREIDCSIFAKQNLENILYLTVNNCDLNDEQFNSICNQKQLIGLFLPKNNITNIDNITNLIELKHLDLYNNDVKDINSLRLLSNLEWLSLNKNNIANISPLKTLTKLRYVSIIGCPIEDYSPVDFVDEVVK